MRRNAKPQSPSLAKDLFITLLLKFTALILIWAVCFSHPMDKKIDTQEMNQHLLSN
ncbi:MAG: hypothetical protein P4M12_09550 [Gammaproteobacteria bacterium]|nr:hypothetical protein [Gammaproteobacteria bacterium]